MDFPENVLKEWLYENEDVLSSFPYDEDGELQDVENLMVLASSKRGIDFICGGDWQKPMWLLLTPERTIEVVERNISFHQPYVYGMKCFLQSLDKKEKV